VPVFVVVMCAGMVHMRVCVHVLERVSVVNLECVNLGAPGAQALKIDTRRSRLFEWCQIKTLSILSGAGRDDGLVAVRYVRGNRASMLLGAPNALLLAASQRVCGISVPYCTGSGCRTAPALVRFGSSTVTGNWSF
jgi:hypothetical protein